MVFDFERARFTHRRREPVKIHVQRVLITIVGHWWYVESNVRKSHFKHSPRV